MKYLVIEIQKNADGTVGNLVFSFDELNVAQSKYHSVLSAAAVSGLPSHAAVLMDEAGFYLDHGFFANDKPNPEEEEVT